MSRSRANSYTVRERVPGFDRYDIDGFQVQDVIDRLQSILNGLPEGSSDVRLNVDHGWSYGDETIEVYIEYTRPMTKEEKAAAQLRKRQLKDHAFQQREKELAELKRLAEKYPEVVQDYA